jgi:hypothetical protein
MSTKTIFVAAVAGPVLLGLMGICACRPHSSSGSLPLDHQPRPAGNASEAAAGLQPESLFIIRVSDSEVVCERPDGKVERVEWSDLQKVEVVTTDEGPFLPDVFFVLHGTTEGCAAPQGATGEDELLERLWDLPGFDNQAFIEAMSSVTNRRFLCWQRAG